MLQTKIKHIKNVYDQVKSARNKNKYSKRRCDYAQYYKKCKVKNIVLYEAFAGRGMLCSPYALFKAFMQRDDFDKYQHVWAIYDMEDNQYIMDQYKDIPNVRFIQFDSSEYLQALAEAKYIINNATFPAYVTKKPEQIYINTWHGIPLKTLGYDLPDGNLAVANVLRNFLSTDYLISPNSFHTGIYLDTFKLQGLYEGTIIEEGQPRSDMIYHADRMEVINELKALGVSIDPDKKIIMYAPTWKGSDFGNPELGLTAYFDFLDKVKSSIDTDEYQVFVKPHQQVYRFIKDDPQISSEFIPATIDTNSLLSVVDILVSDYSSIYFDFLDTKRPVLFYIPDLEMYKNYRGVYFPLEELPGPTTKSLDDIVNWINDIDHVQEEYQEVYDKNVAWACPKDDGRVSEKVWEIVLDHKEGYNVKKADTTSKKKILVYRGTMKDDKVTESFMSLMNQLDHDKYDVTAYVSASAKDEKGQQKILDINHNVRTMKRVGTWNADFKEDFLKEFMFETGIKNQRYMKHFPHEMFHRELERCFGKSQFDQVIDFSGDSAFFSMLCLHVKGAKKFIWQHFDMKKLQKKQKQAQKMEMNTVFSLYPYFDKIISSSEALMKINRKKLGNEQTKQKFTYVQDVLNLKYITECLKKDQLLKIEEKEYLVKHEMDATQITKKLELIKAPEEKNMNFVVLLDLMKKEDCKLLINDFAKIIDEHKEVRVHMIGQTEAMIELQKIVKEQGLIGKVILTGALENPYIYMNRCQCLILPAAKKEKSMKDLEAKAMQLRVLYITPENIMEQVEEFMEDEKENDTFDPQIYNQNVLESFDGLLD